MSREGLPGPDEPETTIFLKIYFGTVADCSERPLSAAEQRSDWEFKAVKNITEGDRNRLLPENAQILRFYSLFFEVFNSGVWVFL